MNKNTYIVIILTAVLIVVVTCVCVYVKPFTRESSSPKVSDIELIGEDFNSGNLDQAIARGEKLVASNPSVDAYLVLAVSYAEKGNASFDEITYGQKAIDMANKALVIDPNDSKAYNIIGYANEIMSKYDEAIINYKKAIELDPNNAQAYTNEGHAYDLQGDLNTAGMLYSQALSIDPNNDNALLNLSRVSMRNNDFSTASRNLNHLVQVSPSSRTKAAAYQLLAFIEGQLDTGKIETAVEYINKAVELDPNMPQAYTLLAELYISYIRYTGSEAERKDIVDKAKVALSKALSINPSSAAAYHSLSSLALTEGDMKLYEEYRQKALEVLPNDITLGAKEKKALGEVIGVTVSDIKVDKK